MIALQVFAVFCAFNFELSTGISQVKREILGVGFGIPHYGFHGFDNPSTGSYLIQKPILLEKPYGPTSAEIATAVAAAKEAASSVIAAQHRAQAAKDEVLYQQKIANQKESQAALALQHAEAAAAVHRQKASAAAQAVVAAQERLAHAKAEVAEQQRIAAAKESHAAVAIQRSAAAAAAEIQKTEHAAAKVSAIQNSEAAATLKHVTAAKDASLAATSAAVSAASAAGSSHDFLPSFFYPQKVNYNW